LALQWAALNNRVAAATLLLERGADVNGADGQGQTALHWAAVRGAVPVSELLLRAGARLDRADSRGYTPCHVAAQYGHAPVLFHYAVRWDANLDVLDGDGRTPLHWAAYKGFADALRLLLMLDGESLRADSEGCTPLHWAAIKGNAEALYLLAQAGGAAALAATDSQGATAAQLAQEKGHGALASYLASQQRAAGRKAGATQRRWLGLVTAGGICALLVLFLNACLLAPALAPPSPAACLAAYLVVGCVGVGLLFMFRAAQRDPGSLRSGLEAVPLTRPGSSARGSAARLDVPALWAGNWGALCVTCKLVRPLGAKHCTVLNRCVARFDHFCPWVGNTIGKHNHRDFLLFLLLQSVALIVSCASAVARIYGSGLDLTHLAATAPGLLSFLAVDLAVALPVVMLTVAQVTQVARALTTNELANMHRYPYLRGREGQFVNPFDRGCAANLRSFMLLNPETRDREVEYSEGTHGETDTELLTLLSGRAAAGAPLRISVLPASASAGGAA